MTTALFESAWGPFAIGLTVGCIVLVASMVALARPRGVWLRDRIDPHGRIEASGAAAASVDARAGWRPSSERVLRTTERALERTRLWRSTMRLLERAGSQVRPAELLWQCLLVGLTLAVIVELIWGNRLVSAAVLAVGLMLPWLRMKRRARRRLRTLDDQLADVLMTMSGSLKVGLTFNNSLQAIVQDGMPPASEEFERLLNETQLGRPMEDALAAMADRIDSEDLRFVLMSVGIQREIGGSLAELLEGVSETVRERQQFRRKVRALTSMGRMSAYILVSLPFVVAISVSILSPDYMDPLFHTTTGHVLIAIMVFMTLIGSLFLRRIVSIKG